VPHPPSLPPGAEPRRSRSLIADLEAIVWEADAPTLAFTFISDHARDLLRCDPAALIADPELWPARIHPDDRARVLERFVRVATEGGSFDDEYRLRSLDGDDIWVRDLGHAVEGEDGNPAIVRGVIVDISAAKAREEEAGAVENRFQRVVEHLPAIVYLEAVERDEELPGAMLYVSPQVEPILGFTPEEWMADPVAWARQFHPDDRARVRREYDRIERTGGDFRAEYRMYTRTGEIRWMRDEAALVRDPDGTPRYWQGIMFDVTAERESEERARTSEARYGALVDQIPAIVYSEHPTADALGLMFINERVEHLLGISREEWLADPGVWLASIHPEDRERVRAENERVEATGEPFEAEYRMIARDGRVRWFADRAVLVLAADGRPAYWQGVMLDITDRKRAEAERSEAEERYRVLVEQIPVVVYVDPVEEGPTVYMSPQSEAMFGYAPEEWYADPDLWSKIIVPEDRDRLDAEPPTDAATASSYRVVAKDGRIVWVHDTSTLIHDEEGTPRFWQGALVDVTEQHRRQELERDLERQRDEADRLRAEDEMRTTFLQAVSHDLRTPLAAILGLAVTLERDDIDLPHDETRDLARRIAQNARKLDALVSDFLDLERLRRGLARPEFAPVDLGALVREIVANSDLVGARRLALDVAPLSVRADGAMVERIVDNLLGNAVKHTPGDSRIWVRVERTDDGALVIVEDDGPGVDPDERERIFEAYRQGSHAAMGSGVGLALVATFAELHGGRAWVQEREGGGASFRVLLAWDPPAPPDPPDDEAQPTGTGSSAESQA
jgi:PAS domain S-box-containing protein